MRIKRVWTFTLAALGLTLAAVPVVRAGKLPVSKTEYSADRTMETEEMTITGKVYHAAEKERAEMNMGGMKQIQIMRRDKKVVWMLMAEQRMYMEHPMGEDDPNRKGPAPDEMEYEMTEVGKETLQGLACTKYKIIATAKDGAKFGGFMWLAQKEGIMVKMDAIAKSEEKDKKMRMKIELTNIKVGPQDASLFEIPSGYSKMNMPMGMGMPPGGPPAKGGKGKGKGGPPAGMPPGGGQGMTPQQIQEMIKKMQQGGGADE